MLSQKKRNFGHTDKIVCIKCNKDFKTINNLNMHMKRKPNCNQRYSCQICNKIFDRKSKLTNHEKRKTPCTPINGDPTVPVKSNQCKFCYKIYTIKSSLLRHLKCCKIKNTDEGMKLLEKTVREKENEKIKNVEKENKDMKDLIKKLITDRNNDKILLDKILINQNSIIDKPIIQNNVIQHNTITNNITINNYNSPNIEDIISPKKLLFMFQKYGSKIAAEIVTDIYFNPDYPENHSIYLTNKKTNELLIYDNTWKSSTCKEAIPPITEVIYGYMNHINLPGFKCLNNSQQNLITDIKNRNLWIECEECDYEQIRAALIIGKEKINKPIIRDI